MSKRKGKRKGKNKKDFASDYKAFWQAKKECHHGNIEIFPNLFLGGQSRGAHAEGMLHICLNGVSLGGDTRFMYVDDFGTPDWSLEEIASVCILIRETIISSPVLVTCTGGHGRTGMVAAMILASLGVENQVEYVKACYCNNAIETEAQKVWAITVGDYMREHLSEFDYTGVPSSKGGWGGGYVSQLTYGNMDYGGKEVGKDDIEAEPDFYQYNASSPEWKDDCPMCGSPMFSDTCDTCGFTYTAGLGDDPYAPKRVGNW